jgi:hypothetical protein
VSGPPTNGSLPKGSAERRRRPGRHAFMAGLLVAALGHGVLLWLNPSMPTRPLSPRATSVALQPAGRLIPVVEVAGDVAPGVLPRSQARPTGPLTAPEQTTDRTSGGGPARDATPGAADRLRYRSSPLWAPPAPIYESIEECRARELTERLAAGVADPSYGRAPPPAGALLQPRAQAGIRIPVGPKPPPAGQYVLPPPLPDSLAASSLPGRPFTRAPRGGWKLRRAPGCTDSIPPLTPGRIRR